MAANPRMVAKNIDVIWDGGTTHVLKGTIVDVPAGSALETAYGVSNLVSIGASSEVMGSDQDSEPEGTGTG